MWFKMEQTAVPGGCAPESPGLAAGFGSGLRPVFDEVNPREQEPVKTSVTAQV